MRRYAFPLLCGLLFGLTQNALADRGGHHGHDHDRDRYDDRRDYREDDRRHDRRPDRRERYEEPRYYAAPPPPPRSSGVNINIQFGGGERQLIREYYDPRFLAGNCPPGLVPYGNDCRPRGHAHGWHRGQRLPSTVVYYPLPRDLRSRMPPPPRGHDYVRVGADILMIAVGTRLVVDAIEDIGR